MKYCLLNVNLFEAFFCSAFLKHGQALPDTSYSFARILIIFSLEARFRKVKSFLIQEIVVCFKFGKLARVGIISNQLDDRTQGIR